MASNKSVDKSADAAVKRANDFGNSYLNMPGYADDTMFFILRYGHKAELEMCKADHKNFMARLHEYNTASMDLHETKVNGVEPEGSIEARAQKVKELREATLAIVKDYPELERDFDRFVSATRAAFKAVNPS